MAYSAGREWRAVAALLREAGSALELELRRPRVEVCVIAIRARHSSADGVAVFAMLSRVCALAHVPMQPCECDPWAVHVHLWRQHWLSDE